MVMSEDSPLLSADSFGSEFFNCGWQISSDRAISRIMRKIFFWLFLFLLIWLVDRAHLAAAAATADADFVALRRQIVEDQLNAPGRHITNPQVLDAMATGPRH